MSNEKLSIQIMKVRKIINILIIVLISFSILFIFLNLKLFGNSQYIKEQIFFLVVYLIVAMILTWRIFMSFRVFVKNAALLEENKKNYKNMEQFTQNLIKQRQAIELMLYETTQLSNKLLEQNMELNSAQQKINSEKVKFTTLFEATQLIMTTWDLEQVLPKIFLLANKLLDFKTGRILLPEKDELIIEYTFGYEKSKSKIEKIKYGEGICGCAAMNKEIIIVENVQNDERYVNELDETKSEIALPLLFQGQLLGILDIQDEKPFDWLAQQDEKFDILVLFSNFAAMVLHNSFTYNQLKDSYVNTIKALARAIDAKDPYTHGHCERVKDLSLEIGKRLELDPRDMEELEFAALLHDIGKIGLPEAILYKPGLLSAVEYEVIKSHPSIGARMIGDIPFLQRTKRIILQHHERIDGKGYPEGLKEHQIDFLSKIISVADAVDAMFSNRPYRDAKTTQFVLEELAKCQGKQFDSLATKIAIEIITENAEELNMA